MNCSGQYYDGYLRKINKNTDPIEWKNIDLSYLLKVIREIRLGFDQYSFVFSGSI